MVHNFTVGGSLLLSVNTSDSDYFSITSLTWYHNGTEIIPEENRWLITENSTQLLITNLEESDAGTYEVKINSTSLDSEYCDAVSLPWLEALAAFAPVTFTVQEQYTPLYDPSSIVSTHYISQDTLMLELSHDTGISAADISFSRFGFPIFVWYRNVVPIAHDSSIYNFRGSTLQRFSMNIATNNTDHIVGDYSAGMYLIYHDIITGCNDYFSFFSEFFINAIPVMTPYWTVKVQGKSEALD